MSWRINCALYGFFDAQEAEHQGGKTSGGEGKT